MIDAAYVFLDANVLLHYPPPEQLDWPKFCNARQIHLVIYPLLLSELSNAKDMNPTKHLRARARIRETALRKWLSDHEQPIRPGVLLLRDSVEPRALMQELGLDRQIKDDMILASAVTYKRDGKSVFVATADGGLAFKLEDHGISVVQLESSLRLAAEIDPEKQRADALEKEIKAIRDRLPRLQISFVNPVTLPRQTGYGTIEEYVARKIDAINEAYQATQRARYGGRDIPNLDNVFQPRYASERQLVSDFLAAEYRWLTAVEGATKIQLIVHNHGDRGATNVRVRLTPPQHVSMRTDGGFGSPPQSIGTSHPFAGLIRDASAVHIPTYNIDDDRDGSPKRVAANPTMEMRWSKVEHHGHVFSRSIWLTALPEAVLGNSALNVAILYEEIGSVPDAHLRLDVVES